MNIITILLLVLPPQILSAVIMWQAIKAGERSTEKLLALRADNARLSALLDLHGVKHKTNWASGTLG